MTHLLTQIDSLDNYFKDNSIIEENSKNLVTRISNNMGSFYRCMSSILDLIEYKNKKVLFYIKQTNFKIFMEGLAREYTNITLDYNPKAPTNIEIDEAQLRKLFNVLVIVTKELGIIKSHDNIIEIIVENDFSVIINNRSCNRIRIDIKCKSKDPAEVISSANMLKWFNPSNELKTIDTCAGVRFSIASEIVKAHCGEIIAYKDPNLEFIFSIIIPVEYPNKVSRKNTPCLQADEEEINIRKITQEVSSLEDQFRGRVPRILVIAGSTEECHRCGTMIMSFCYEYKGVSSVKKAIEYISSNEFEADLILLDMILQDGNGLTIIQSCYDKLLKMDVPIIIKAGFFGKDDITEQALRSGLRCFLHQYYNSKGFHDMLKLHLGLL